MNLFATMAGEAAPSAGAAAVTGEAGPEDRGDRESAFGLILESLLAAVPSPFGPVPATPAGTAGDASAPARAAAAPVVPSVNASAPAGAPAPVAAAASVAPATAASGPTAGAAVPPSEASAGVEARAQGAVTGVSAAAEAPSRGTVSGGGAVAGALSRGVVAAEGDEPARSPAAGDAAGSGEAVMRPATWGRAGAGPAATVGEGGTEPATRTGEADGAHAATVGQAGGARAVAVVTASTRRAAAAAATGSTEGGVAAAAASTEGVVAVTARETERVAAVTTGHGPAGEPAESWGGRARPDTPAKPMGRAAGAVTPRREVASVQAAGAGDSPRGDDATHPFPAPPAPGIGHPAVAGREVQPPGAASGAAAAPGTVEEGVTMAELLPRLVRSLAWEAAGDGRRRVTLHLVPEHLGRVQVDMVLRGGDLRAAFTVDRPEVALAIQQQLADLGSVLRQHGLHVAHLAVALAGAGTGDGSGGARQRAEERPDGAQARAPGANRRAGAVGLPAARAGPEWMPGMPVLDLLA